MTLHAFNQRILAEDLVRVRRPDDRERYAAAQRQARIDPNPHQIDAVIFALRRLGEGGCIPADEVGLGKTIEAGLVIAQSRAEGAERVLLIVPKSLIGQWQDELLHLFGIQARGVFEIHTGNQWPTLILPVLAKALGRSQDTIVLRSYLLGGGFRRLPDRDYSGAAA